MVSSLLSALPLSFFEPPPNSDSPFPRPNNAMLVRATCACDDAGSRGALSSIELPGRGSSTPALRDHAARPASRAYEHGGLILKAEMSAIVPANSTSRNTSLFAFPTIRLVQPVIFFWNGFLIFFKNKKLTDCQPPPPCIGQYPNEQHTRHFSCLQEDAHKEREGKTLKHENICICISDS